MEKLLNQPQWTKVSEVELIYKSKVKASERPAIKSSKDSYQVLLQTWDEDKIQMQETFKVLLLNTANKVTGVFEVSSGGVTGTVADSRLILAAAIKSVSTAVILSHNHPSGSVRPSRADIELTDKIKHAASYHEIKILDHIILTPESYYSFADEGLL